MAAFGRLWSVDPALAREAARLNAELLGRLVSSAGVTFNCLPMLDVRAPDAAESVIGDRALSDDADVVAALGRAVMEGLASGGATPIIKHLPGHGRARVDSHHALPRVEADRDSLASVDFAPFRALADAPAGMTAHVVYEALDPDRPATLSPIVITEVIRGEIGFDGLLFSDDLKMNALAGELGSRAAAALAAGCDIALCCNYSLEQKIANERLMRPMTAEAAARSDRALASRSPGARDRRVDDDYQRLAAMLSAGAAA